VSILHRSIPWIMLISGLLTCTAFYEVFAPQAALQGTSLNSPMELLIVRHWGALVGLFGLLLIYGAFKAPARRLILAATTAGKAVFILLALLQGLQTVFPQAGAGIVIDSITVLLFATYLVFSTAAATTPVQRDAAAAASKSR
jgi:hypothetical protein